MRFLAEMFCQRNKRSFCWHLDLQAREHRKFAVAEGDHLTMLNVYEAFIKVQLSGLLWASIIFKEVSLIKVMWLSSTLSTAPEELAVVSGTFSELQGSGACHDRARTASTSHEQVQSAEDFQWGYVWAINTWISWTDRLHRSFIKACSVQVIQMWSWSALCLDSLLMLPAFTILVPTGEHEFSIYHNVTLSSEE